MHVDDLGQCRGGEGIMFKGMGEVEVLPSYCVRVPTALVSCGAVMGSIALVVPEDVLARAPSTD